MIFVRVAFALVGLSLLANAPPKARMAATEVICVGGPKWSASPDETRQIRQQPIPVSYRSLFESKAPCVRWALNTEWLVDWHLGFGTEASVEPALAYLENDYLKGIPPVARYRAQLEQAATRAIPDLHRARSIKQPPGLNYSAQGRFMESREAIRAFRRLEDDRHRYKFLAAQYLRAAEEFGSKTLLDQADRYLKPALDAAEFLEPLERQPPFTLFAFNLHTYETDDLKMRAAILRAPLTRRPNDIAAAETIVRSLRRPLYDRIAETAASGGDDFCDIDRGWSQAEETEAACRSDDEIEFRVVHYWVNRAILDFLEAKPEVRSDELATRLLDWERLSDGSHCCARSATEELFRLLQARAAMHERRARELAAAGDSFKAQDDWRQALLDLQQAERLITPFDAPRRFERVARHSLALWDAESALFGSEEERRRHSYAGDARYRAYLRALLGKLDSIAIGESESPRGAIQH